MYRLVYGAPVETTRPSEAYSSTKDDHGAVRAVELGDGLAALDAPWVAGSRDDVVEDDLFGQQVEEVPTIGNAIEALLDDAKERVERLEVVEVGDRRRHDGPRLCPRLRVSPGEVSELDRSLCHVSRRRSGTRMV